MPARYCSILVKNESNCRTAAKPSCSSKFFANVFSARRRAPHKRSNIAWRESTLTSYLKKDIYVRQA